MALTFIKDLTAISNPAIGYAQDVIMSFISNTPLTGNSLYLNFYRYTQGVLPLLTNAVPDQGYSVEYPAINGAHPLTLIAGTDTSYMEPNVVLIRKSSTEFELRIVNVTTSDFNSKITTDTFDSLQRFTHPIQPGTAFENDTPSFFNGSKRWIFEVTETDGVTINQVLGVGDLNAGKFWNKSAFNTAPIRSFGFRWSIGGTFRSCFSVFEDAVFELVVWDQTNTFNAYNVGILRADDVNNDDVYTRDTELNYVAVDSLGNISLPFLFTIDSAAFLSATPIIQNPTNTNEYRTSVTISKDYFVYNATYYIYFVTKEDEANQQSVILGPFSASCDPPPSTGIITSEIIDYNFGSAIFSSACTINHAICERIQIKVTHDKDTYFDAIQANGLTGDFESNLIEVRACIADDPHVIGDTPQCLQQVTGLTVTNETGPDVNIATLDLRIPESWSGQTNYIWFIWRFSIPIGDGQTYIDQIYYPVRIDVRTEDSSGLGVIAATIEQDGAVVNGQICADPALPVSVNTTLALPTPENYSFIALIQEQITNAEWLENNSYPNTNLETFDIAELTNQDVDFAGGDADLTINTEDLTTGSEYCLKLIAKEKTGTIPAACGCIRDFMSRALFAVVSSNGWQIIKIEFDITSLIDSDVGNIAIYPYSDLAFSNLLTSVSNPIPAVFDGLASGSFFVDYPPTSPGVPADPVNILLDIFVTLADGCYYRFTRPHTLEFTEDSLIVITDVCPICTQTLLLTSALLPCDYTILMYNESFNIPDDSVQFTMSAETLITNTCDVPITRAVNKNSENDVSVQHSYIDWDAGGGGFVNDIRISIHDGVGVVGATDINLSAAVFAGGTGAAFNNFVATVLIPLLQTEIAAWTLANFGFSAVNNTHYALRNTVSQNAPYDVNIDFLCINNTTGFWLGIDKNNLMSDYSQDGSPVIVAGGGISAPSIQYIDDSEIIDCNVLYYAIQLSDYIDVTNTNFYTLAINAPGTWTHLPDGTPNFFALTNHFETCFETIEISASLSSISSCPTISYAWTYDNGLGGGPVALADTTATIQVPIDDTGTYEVTVVCGVCVYTESIIIS